MQASFEVPKNIPFNSVYQELLRKKPILVAYLLKYALDIESKSDLSNHNHFCHPIS